MKILMLSNCPTVESQGSGYVIINTARCLINLGHDVTVVPPNSISLFSFFKSVAVSYRMILGMAWWIITHKIKKYDLIVFYGAECVLAVIILKKIFRSKTPIILHSNGLEILVNYNLNKYSLADVNLKKWFHYDISRIYRFCYNIVHIIITVSNSERDFAINKLGINPNKIVFINPGLPSVYFNYDSMYPKKKIITYCGTWIKRKGVGLIEIAIPELLSEFIDYKFRIIGVGSEFQVEKHFPDASLKQIEVIPFVADKKKLMDLYNESEIFLFPSFSESFGLVIAEAMYCGCALITGPTGFAAELQNNFDAIVLSNPNAECIVTSVRKLINETEFRDFIASNGKLKVANLSWYNFEQKFKIALEEVLTSS